MKKLISSLFVVALISFYTEGVMAQSYQQGDKLLNVGVGLGTYGAGGIGFGGSFEYGIHEAISVGVLGGYSGRSNYLGSGARWSVFTIGARGSYHFNELLNLDNDQIDLYAGLGLGYRNISWSIDGLGGSIYNNAYNGGIHFLGHIGGKYYFQPNLGIFAELGSGFGVLQAGISFKF
ncbi:hypothetical protein [Persicitalea sp.]|uniref:hypothetical protein n=1 Tax=Persicitalea sp. TaxID=3100273 RepID=UPI00359309AC